MHCQAGSLGFENGMLQEKTMDDCCMAAVLVLILPCLPRLNVSVPVRSQGLYRSLLNELGKAAAAA